MKLDVFSSKTQPNSCWQTVTPRFQLEKLQLQSRQTIITTQRTIKNMGVCVVLKMAAFPTLHKEWYFYVQPNWYVSRYTRYWNSNIVQCQNKTSGWQLALVPVCVHEHVYICVHEHVHRSRSSLGHVIPRVSSLATLLTPWGFYSFPFTAWCCLRIG